ncbi:GIY-YIG nuclease family protein [Patescibacteria group bacterium]|nr:MAG: GIY-YIG nuclease family protein [Patescibacteria group bacterium]
MKFFVYIVKCRDNSFYTGSTSNIQKRVNEHNFGKLGAKSLRGKLPVQLIYSEEFKTRSQALRREIEIKSWRREKKVELIDTHIRSRV